MVKGVAPPSRAECGGERTCGTHRAPWLMHVGLFFFPSQPFGPATRGLPGRGAVPSVRASSARAMRALSPALTRGSPVPGLNTTRREGVLIVFVTCFALLAVSKSAVPTTDHLVWDDLTGPRRKRGPELRCCSAGPQGRNGCSVVMSACQAEELHFRRSTRWSGGGRLWRVQAP